MTGATPLRHILLVEDEESIAMTVSDRLRAEGYQVETVANGDDGFSRALSGGFDLLILDVALPGRNGFDICRDLRQQSVSTPILMLTARAQVVDRVVGLKLGADDYLPKPFEMMELLARVEALIRRGRAGLAPSADAYAFGPVSVDFRSADVKRNGASVELSSLELKLLRYFIDHRGAVLSRDELLDKVWGYDSMPQTRTVDVHVAALRQKLEERPSHPKYFITVHGMGYKFVG